MPSDNQTSAALPTMRGPQPPGTVRVMIVDDDGLARDALTRYVALDADVTIVGVYADAFTMLDALATTAADVVVLDVRMPGMDGLAAAAVIRERHPGVKVLLMTCLAEEAVLRRAAADGVNGFLFKDTAPETFADAIRAVHRGVLVWAPEVREFAADGSDVTEASRVTLKERESEVLDLLCAGLSTRQIAQELCLSVSSIKVYTASLMAKLDAATRLQAVVRAHDLGLVGQSTVNARADSP